MELAEEKKKQDAARRQFAIQSEALTSDEIAQKMRTCTKQDEDQLLAMRFSEDGDHIRLLSAVA
jgi:hypothetical protein